MPHRSTTQYEIVPRDGSAAASGRPPLTAGGQRESARSAGHSSAAHFQVGLAGMIKLFEEEASL